MCSIIFESTLFIIYLCFQIFSHRPPLLKPNRFFWSPRKRQNLLMFPQRAQVTLMCYVMCEQKILSSKHIFGRISHFYCKIFCQIHVNRRKQFWKTNGSSANLKHPGLRTQRMSTSANFTYIRQKNIERKWLFLIHFAHSVSTWWFVKFSDTLSVFDLVLIFVFLPKDKYLCAKKEIFGNRYDNLLTARKSTN